jgi:hypothetical protein
MGTGLGTSRVLSAWLLAAACTMAVGCRTSETDIHRWGETLNGPKKLEAVIRSDKYSLDLRTEAALTLIRMKPRNGRRIGIEGGEDPEQTGVIAVFASLPKDVRTKMISALIPQLDANIKEATEHKGNGPDTSFPYKDTAFALLTHDNGALLTNEEERRRLRELLSDWVAGDFAGRIDEPSQIFSVDQVLGALRAQGVKKLPELIAPNAPKLDRIVQFISDFGDDETKLRASKKIVEVAEYTASAKWKEDKTPQLKKANQDSKLNPTAKQFEDQLAQYQEEELVRLFASMKKIGGKPVVDFLIAFGSNKSLPEKQRLAALAALENNLDKNDPKHADAMFALASASDTPDSVRDQALRRIGEMPRKNVITRLFGLFDHPNWKVRWVAAELVLKMSDSTQLPEFMTRLGEVKHMALAEPLRYGDLLNDVKGPQKPEVFVPQYCESNYRVPARLSALSWYFNHGSAKDVEILKKWSTDKSATPKCAPDAKDCEWKCEAPTADGKTDVREVANVGEFVVYCVIPEIDRRNAPQKK